MRAFIIVILFLSSECLYSQNIEQLDIKASFDKYKQAILNDRGEEAATIVDTRTIKYYQDMLDLVKNADSLTLISSPIIDKIMVFSIRHRATREEIISFDANGLFIYAIKQGMVSKNSVSNISLGEVTVEGSFAKGQIVSKGQLAPIFFHFYKEENIWKINLTSLFPMTNVLFKKMVADSGQEENEYLFSLLEMLTGKKPGKEIWEKVN